MNRFFTYFLLFIVAMQGTLASATQQAKRSDLEIHLPDDIEIICTGSSMRYVSISASLLANRFVFVERPVTVEQNIVDQACPAKAMLDHQPVIKLPFSLAISLYLVTVYQPVVKTQPTRYQSVSYLKSSPRAPPITLTHS